MDPPGSSFNVSQEEFILFHRIDRDLYRVLTINLNREPSESMQVLAMWLWLERVGFCNVVKKIMSLPNLLINEVAEETVTCLNCISNSHVLPHSSEGVDIPLLQSFLDKEISLQFLYENRVEALEGVAKMVQEVCVRAFTDIMQQAIIRNTNERMEEAQNAVAQSSENNSHFWFGSIGPSHVRVNKVVGVQNSTSTSSSGGDEVPADDRTMFVTFSKGYRVEEWEVREFFSLAYGDCIEALYMQEVQPNEQSLFARIVFRNVSTIDVILRGATKVKFTISGKHVWARKFVRKRTRSLLPTSTKLPAESSSGSGM